MPSTDQVQSLSHSNLTSSANGTFYFAYGSNLSPTQMQGRCLHSPSSSVPVAVAQLPTYRWIICQRGYANVVPLPVDTPASNKSTVWGIIYNMTPEDEATLDNYEGHDDFRNPEPEINPDPETQTRRPYLQAGWDYNKHYLPVTVTQWLRNPADYGVNVPSYSHSATNSHVDPTTIRALVYVDELRTDPGTINDEYIGRMNRGIREAVELGLPDAWVEEVMRRDIPAGREVDGEGYVGTEHGYVEAEATETSDHRLKEWMLREEELRREAGFE